MSEVPTVSFDVSLIIIFIFQQMCVIMNIGSSDCRNFQKIEFRYTHGPLFRGRWYDATKIRLLGAYRKNNELETAIDN